MLENITVTSQTTASILSQTTEKMEKHLAQQTQLITQMVATQTSMAESLEQIVSLLQVQNQWIESLTDCQCQQEETPSSPALTTVTTPNEPIPQTQSQQAKTRSSPTLTTVTAPNEAITQTQSQQAKTTSSPTLTTDTTPNEPTTQMQSLPVDCSSVSAADNHGSGVYTIDPRDGSGSFKVFCDMDNGGGGWTVFQKRFDGSVDFFLRWDEYEQGFGNVSGEYWLGLQQMHRLTSSGRWTLRIDMEDFEGNVKYAQYKDFQIGDAASFYQLSIGALSGTVGYNALSYHNGKPFSTKDSDHDNCTPSFCQSYCGSCALRFQGGWWYHTCHYANLNGLYQGSTSPVPHDIPWSLMCWKGWSSGSSEWKPLKTSEIKIRRVQ